MTLTAEALREQVLDASAKLRDSFIRYDAGVRRTPRSPPHTRRALHENE